MNASESTEGFRKKLSEICSRKDFPNNRQNVHTPYTLCGEMIDKLDKSTSLHDKTFLTMNLEFVEVLIYDYGVDKSKIWCILDCSQKAVVLEKHERYTGVNVVRGDFLTWKPDMKFDVIVGNPPYQETDSNGKSVRGGGVNLWEKFLRESTEMLKPHGYLCFLNPSGWRNYGSKLFSDIFQQYDIIYVNILTAEKYFPGVGSKFDWYILRNSVSSHNTTVEWLSDVRTVNLSSVSGLPNNPTVFGITEKLRKDIHQLEFQNIQTHHHTRSHMSKVKTKDFIYPIRHTGAQDPWWSSKKHLYQSRKKVFISCTGHLNPIYDGGVMGTSQNCHFILVSSKKEGEYIIRFLNSKLYRAFIAQNKTSGFNDLKILRLLPYPKGLPDDFTDQDLYKYFKLTKEEIELVESSGK